MINLDHQFFNLIYSLKGTWPLLDACAFFCAKYLIFFMAVLVIVWWLKLNYPFKNFSFNQQKMPLHISLAAGISFLVSQLIGLIYFRPRPFASNSDVINDINPMSEKSFPSDHTTIAFAIAAAVYCHHKKMGALLLILALLVGLGRIYTGVHYPLDVVGGIIVGTISVFGLNYFFRFKK